MLISLVQARLQARRKRNGWRDYAIFTQELFEVQKMNIEYCLFQNNHEPLFAKLKSQDPTRRFKVTVQPWKSKRSIEQNSRLWALYEALGKHIGDDADSIHELMGFKFLRNLKTVNGESIEVIKSTTKLNTAEMADYQDSIERWAASIGFYFEG